MCEGPGQVLEIRQSRVDTLTAEPWAESFGGTQRQVCRKRPATGAERSLESLDVSSCRRLVVAVMDNALTPAKVRQSGFVRTYTLWEWDQTEQ